MIVPMRDHRKYVYVVEERLLDTETDPPEWMAWLPISVERSLSEASEYPNTGGSEVETRVAQYERKRTVKYLGRPKKKKTRKIQPYRVPTVRR